MTTYATGKVLAFPRKTFMDQNNQLTKSYKSYFTLGSDKPVTEEQAKGFQERQGYPVCDWGFSDFTQDKMGVKYMARWYCGVCDEKPRGEAS